MRPLEKTVDPLLSSTTKILCNSRKKKKDFFWLTLGSEYPTIILFTNIYVNVSPEVEELRKKTLVQISH